MIIFSLSGSLREASSNTQILSLLKPLLPKNTEMIMYKGLGILPHYNSDLDQDNEPDEVRELRGMIARSSAVIISTPEYAHGIPGSLKNALDWLVSTIVLENKPVGIIIGSTSDGNYAEENLTEVLKAMSANVVISKAVELSKVHDQTINSDLKNFVDGFLSKIVVKS